MTRANLSAFLRKDAPSDKALIFAELYGPSADNQHLAIIASELTKILTHVRPATIIDLSIDGQKAFPVLIREIQRDPVKGGLVHIDLLKLDMSRKVIVNIDLVPTGKSAAITNQGAALVKNLTSLKVECLPENLVNAIEVDLSKLATASATIRVEDLILPEGMKVKNSPRDVVFSLAASRKGRAAGADSPAGEPAAAAPAAGKAAPEKKEDKKADKKKK